MSVTFTQADLDNLKAALVTGAESVQIGDRNVRYRSQADLLKAIKMVSEYLSGQTTPTTTANIVQATFSKGSKT